MATDINRIEETIQEYMDKELFQIYLQPICDFHGNLVEAEALIRLVKGKKIISPMRFIPIMEELHVVSFIDLFVFERVCRRIQRWNQQRLRMLSVSFNFSRETFQCENLEERMKVINEKYEVSPKSLVIEITERTTWLPEDDLLVHLQEEGFCFSLDDFGVEYSNLKSLIQFPLSFIKLDKSLVDEVETNWKDRVLLKNVIDISHLLGMKVIAEGVESQFQYDYFKRNGCDLVQGYYIDQPLPLWEFEKKYMKV